jgi:hypothetical protein
MGELRNAYIIFVGKPQGKKPLDKMYTGMIVYY